MILTLVHVCILTWLKKQTSFDLWFYPQNIQNLYYLYYMYIFIFNWKKAVVCNFYTMKTSGRNNRNSSVKMFVYKHTTVHFLTLNICMNPFMHLLPFFFFFINCGCHKVKTLSRAFGLSIFKQVLSFWLKPI